VENQTPYVLHVFETFRVKLALVYLKYCEFCEFNLVHLFQGTKETTTKPQRKRILHPKRPFYTHNAHR